MINALGLLEVDGMVAAIDAADAMLKAANVRLLSHEVLDPGRLTLVVEGDLAACRAALDAGCTAAMRTAPVMLAYSARNRSASIRIPVVSSPKARRIEVRFPDPAANPYLCFAALLMAGLDGIKNKIHPGEAMDKNLYDLPPEEAKEIPQVAGSLEEALNELDLDREFLKAGGVFTDEAIDAYIALRREEDDRVRMTPHPVEFELYYSV